MKRLVVCLMLGIGTMISVYAQSSTDMEKKITELMNQMTLEEKVAMCHAQSKFSSPGVPRLGIPEIWMSDGPHGVRGEINWDNWGYADWTNDYITAFPALTCLAATFNPELSYDYGVALGEEARYRKKDILLGPGVNIYRTPLNGRNFEYMGEDPYLASVMVVPYIKGVQTNGVAACVKHYVLNNQEQWRGHISVNVSDRALHEIYLPAFKSAVQEAGVWSIMGAYNKFRGQHTTHHELLNKILKEDWEFDGVVVSDWGSAHDTKEAAIYGLDIEMGSWTNGLTSSIDLAYDNYYLATPFLKMLKEGEISEDVLDDKVRRILRLMLRTNMSENRAMGRMNNSKHSDVARSVAADGIVLLKNENDFFPIKPDAELTIAVIGENATRSMTVGGGSSELKAKYEISPLEGIQKRYAKANILHSLGYASGPSAYGREIPSELDADSLVNEALELAAKADIVLFVGGLNKNHYQDCEGGDRKHYKLPFGQDELIEKLVKVNSNLGVVLVSGNAVEMPWLSQVEGLIQSWYNGSEAGNALADILSGDVTPSGKLPYSYPVKLKDNGAHYYGELSYPGDSIEQYYKEDLLVGYRWHDTKKFKPQFAFGYGLSYTSFKMSDFKLNNKQYNQDEIIKVTCKVTNTGDVAGAEVVQVYVGKPKSKIKRSVKELKGFNKIYLEAGESKTVTIEIPVEKLKFYDETVSDWSLEQGNYVIYIGNASDNILNKQKINIK
ncbi:glycoside hydrolase family 3 C-terminal domain-containing protein [Carboxylicivirga sp. A043]|uniref:beta-glucosidase family protein n=1 Tax=Carboxylicivirga litoralis TaxID=2816963 RepID=UPI0021CB11F0|nr:glycoside hydrolase family 3 C-terminal domain-containing protein [Carboxylicivirga sp. A043]MCU4155621.1 glycoside hydrolase family 3 C-terminal domain-containing protein [Carboxylicivirga sp. A043]